MDQGEVYQWRDSIRERLGVGHWQAEMLAGMSMGIMAGRNCTLSTIAEHLGCLGKADSVERRIQRFLANERVAREKVQAGWIRWVMDSVGLGSERITVLVDETKLGDHLNMMMVGLAYEQRCLGLAWRCYAPDAWPCGQVELIVELLTRVKAALPEGIEVLLEADRGIGTSPDLVKAVLALGWHVLFRVQGITHFHNEQVADCQLQTLIQRGANDFHATGAVFKKADWLPMHICLVWDAPYDEPWCLISDVRDLTGREYGKRNWQEQSFRDLKSGGWRWNASQVWQPAHAERLVLALLLAYAFILSLGLRPLTDLPLKRNVSRGNRQRWSLFRLGLRVLSDLRRRAELLRFFLDLSQPIVEFLPSG